MKLVRLHAPPSGSVEEAAAYWVMRLDSPGCAPSDRAAFEKWRATHPSHAEAYSNARRALATVDQHLGSAELTRLGERVFRETGKSPRPLRRYAGMGFAAACALILGVLLYPPSPADPQVDQQPRVAAGTFETAVGERSTVGLPDDSSVTLNTDTVVEVRFAEHSDVRRLVLVRGQAHFEVAKDPRPFEVLALGRRIVAMGTAFDVRIDAELGVLVTLLEGRVAVDEVNRGATALAPTRNPVGVAASGGTVLNAGEQLIARRNEPPRVVTVDMEQVAGWRAGQLVFRDDPLRDVIDEINRYSTRKLVLDDDERLDGIQIGGVFKAGSTDSFLRAVEELYPVEAHRLGPDQIALVWVDEASDIQGSAQPLD
ncbi:MAG: FecR domain-containing protein [Gammaproteobacteria bacterium]|nr:FecR domain-containing protein [Gammaproteobacteria bacterium]